MDKIKRGDILWIDLGKSFGRYLQSGHRPCVVISTDKANVSAKTFNVIPGTTKYEKKDFPVHFKLLPEDINGFLGKPIVFFVEQICTVHEKQVLCKTGHIKDNGEIVHKINQLIIRQLGLGEEGDGK